MKASRRNAALDHEASQGHDRDAKQGKPEKQKREHDDADVRLRSF